MSEASLCFTNPNILRDSGGNEAEIGDLVHNDDGARARAWAAVKISVSW